MGIPVMKLNRDILLPVLMSVALFPTMMCAQSASFLARQAGRGSGQAQYKYGVLLEEGSGGKVDASAAYELYQKASAQGVPEAQYRLGLMLAAGRGCAADPGQAAIWIEEAARKENAAAQEAMGVICEYGLGFKKDAMSAAQWYLRAAKAGRVGAQFNVARCYGEGIGFPKDSSVARDWLLKAAEGRHPAAWLVLSKVSQDSSAKLEAWSKAAVMSGFHPAMATDLSGDSPLVSGARAAHAQKGYGDWRTAFLCYREAAKAGAPDALRTLYQLEVFGIGTIPDSVDGISLLRRAAALGDPVASLDLGCRMETGEGVAKDVAGAMELIKKAAESGHPEAAYAMAKRCLRGGRIPRDTVAALRWYKVAAAAGHVAAQAELGERLASGLAGDAGKQEGAELLRKAAEGGDPFAQYTLGLRKLAVDSDESRVAGIRLLEDSARHGNSDAHMALANHYLGRDGARGGARPHLAYGHLEALSLTGNVDAQWMLVGLYLSGVGAPQSTSSASVWCDKAANAGHAAAQNLMGTFYLTGRGVPVNQETAEDWFRRSAEKKHPLGCVNYGSMLARRGMSGVARAEPYFQSAIDSGDAEALQAAGIFYVEKYRYQGGAAKGIDLLVRAANAGAVDSMLFMARVHQEGLGVPINRAEAMRWYSRAAEAGSLAAARKLAEAYEVGDGVPKSTEDAVRWRNFLEQFSVFGAPLSSGEFKVTQRAGSKVAIDEQVGEFLAQAKSGDVRAQYNLGLAYLKGVGVSKNSEFAKEWLRKAAAVQYAPAMNALATVAFSEWRSERGMESVSQNGTGYAQGGIGRRFSSGAPAPITEVPSFLQGLRSAALCGDADAVMNVGLCYANGWGVMKDLDQAYAWLSVSSAMGARLGLPRRLVLEEQIFGAAERAGLWQNSRRLTLEQAAANLWRDLQSGLNNKSGCEGTPTKSDKGGRDLV